MSIKKTAFLNLGTYLMGVLQNNSETYPEGILPASLNLPGLSWFDKQMGQFTNPQMALAIPLPCILMEYQPFTWVSVGKNEQRGNGNIRFYVYFENYADAFTGSVNQTLALQFFEYTEQVQIALQGYGFKGMQPLERVGDAEDSAEDMIITSTMDYGTILNDVAALEDRKYVMANPTVVVEKVDTTTRPARPGFINGYIIP